MSGRTSNPLGNDSVVNRVNLESSEDTRIEKLDVINGFLNSEYKRLYDTPAKLCYVSSNKPLEESMFYDFILQTITEGESEAFAAKYFDTGVNISSFGKNYSTANLNFIVLDTKKDGNWESRFLSWMNEYGDPKKSMADGGYVRLYFENRYIDCYLDTPRITKKGGDNHSMISVSAIVRFSS